LIASAVGQLLLVPNVLLAQDTATAATATGGDESVELPAMLVTGSLIPTAATVGPAPVDVSSAERIQEIGIADILQTLKRVTPSLSGNLNTGQEINNGGFGESYVSIRNLRTLVMLNGRRLGNSSFSNGQLVDLNTIPLAAIERVEVLKDGASALYGSEAIGGVINIITKKNYSGVEVGGRYGLATQQGSVAEYGASIVGGWQVEKGSFMATAQYYHVDPLLSTDRPIAVMGPEALEAAGIFPFGVSYLSPSFAGKTQEGGTGASYLLNYPTYRTPPVLPGQTFPGPTAIEDYLAAFRAANPGAPDPYLPISGGEVINTPLFGTATIQSQDRKNFFGSGNYEIFEERMEVFGEFLYANIESEGALAPSPMIGLGAKQSNINIPANNPYNPFGIDLGPLGGAGGLPPGGPRVRSRFIDAGNRVFDSQTDYYHFVGGLRGRLERDYSYDAAFTYNRYDQIQETRNAINGAGLDLALQPALDAGGQPILDPVSGRPLSRLIGSEGAVPVYNIFSGSRDVDGFNDPRTLNALRTTLFQAGISEQWDFNAVISGMPFDLPAGSFGFAGGFAGGQERLSIDFDGLTKIGKVPGLLANNPTSGRRDNWAVFLETRIPIISPEMDIPGIYSLEVNAAGRYESFHPGGDAAVPKVGVRWQPLDNQFTLRGSYSESFVAPTTYELFGGKAVNVPALVVPATDAGDLGFFQEYTANLSNPGLEPAKAKNWGAGIVISPEAIKGLTVSVDYYHISTEDDIFRVSQQEMANSLNTLGSASPWARYFTKADGSLITTTAPNQANDATWGNLDVPLLNGAEIETDGIDITVNYSLPTDRHGTFMIFANANVTFSYEYKDPVSGGPFPYEGQYTDTALGIAGAQGTIPDFIINTGLTWEIPVGEDALTYAINAQYIPEVDSLGSLHPSNLAFERDFDDLLNDYTVDGSVWTVDAWYRIDMQLSYELGKHRMEPRWYDNTRLTVGCNNITDNDPPLIAAAFEDNTDKSTYDIYGRFFYVELSKKF
jgi:iron complex outermembrane receptor protein